MGLQESPSAASQRPSRPEQNVDLIEGERLHVALKTVKYQQALKRYYDKNAKPDQYNEGDLVLKRRTSVAGKTKMSAPWEGPYVVKEVLG